LFFNLRLGMSAPKKLLTGPENKLRFYPRFLRSTGSGFVRVIVDQKRKLMYSQL